MAAGHSPVPSAGRLVAAKNTIGRYATASCVENRRYIITTCFRALLHAGRFS